MQKELLNLEESMLKEEFKNIKETIQVKLAEIHFVRVAVEKNTKNVAEDEIIL